MFQDTAPPASARPSPDSPSPEAGDADARPATLADLFEADESRFLRHALTLTSGDFAAAQDLVQEAFLRLHRHGYERVERPRAWLVTVIRRLACDRRKKHTEAPLPDRHDPADLDATEIPAALERAEAVTRLRLHMADLPVRDREILRLRFHEELDYAGIAARTGVSQGNVGYRLHLLVRKLASLMRE